MYPSIRIKNQKQKWDNQTTNKITTKNVIQNKVGFKSTNHSQCFWTVTLYQPVQPTWQSVANLILTLNTSVSTQEL